MIKLDCTLTGQEFDSIEAAETSLNDRLLQEASSKNLPTTFRGSDGRTYFALVSVRLVPEFKG